jgi:hypothetical protein
MAVMLRVYESGNDTPLWAVEDLGPAISDITPFWAVVDDGYESGDVMESQE